MPHMMRAWVAVLLYLTFFGCTENFVSQGDGQIQSFSIFSGFKIIQCFQSSIFLRKLVLSVNVKKKKKKKKKKKEKKEKGKKIKIFEPNIPSILDSHYFFILLDLYTFVESVVSYTMYDNNDIQYFS